jgi:telomerase reverse transcriptase
MPKHVFRPKLYFVKVDVRAAFDTIDQNKLLEILRKMLSEVSFSRSLGVTLAKGVDMHVSLGRILN